MKNYRSVAVHFLILSLAVSFGALPVFSKGINLKKCSETITVDGNDYPVPERWCGKKIPYKDLAKTDNLAKLPPELCEDSLKIYVSKETKQALLKMSESARKAGIKLIVDSGFRSVWYQKVIIKRRLDKGETYEKLITFVAPPGYSQHHTGRAVDFVPSEARFAHTDTYKWLQKNAANFGFHETYPEDTTGAVPWESWHWVYEPK